MEGATVEGELAEGSVKEYVEEGLARRVSRGKSCAVCRGICPVIHRGADLSGWTVRGVHLIALLLIVMRRKMLFTFAVNLLQLKVCFASKKKTKPKNAEKQSEKHSKRDTKGALTFGLIYGTFWAQAQKLQQIVVVVAVARFVAVVVVAHATARPHTAETRVSINQLFAAAQGIGKRERERDREVEERGE